MTISDLGQHAGEDFQAKVFFVSESVRPQLDDPDLGVDSLNEAEGNFIFRLAISGDAVPVPVNQSGKLLIGFEPLPFQGFFPVTVEYGKIFSCCN